MTLLSHFSCLLYVQLGAHLRREGFGFENTLVVFLVSFLPWLHDLADRNLLRMNSTAELVASAISITRTATASCEATVYICVSDCLKLMGQLPSLPLHRRLPCTEQSG